MPSKMSGLRGKKEGQNLKYGKHSKTKRTCFVSHQLLGLMYSKRCQRMMLGTAGYNLRNVVKHVVCYFIVPLLIRR